MNSKKKENIRENKTFPEQRKNLLQTLHKNIFREVSEEMGFEFFPSLPWLLGNSEMLLNFQNLQQQAKELLELSGKYYPHNEEIAKRLACFDIDHK